MVSETPARPVDADEVFRIIRERLADILEIEESRITLEASFPEAVLGLVVTDFIYRAFPHLPEGELAKVRASVVNAGVLAELATEIELGTFVLLGKGEGLSGGREKPSILADAMEAVLAATYLDGGWDAAYKLVMALRGARLAAA